jgi:trehalose synthase
LRYTTLWNINSTATGGGVAEMLPSLLGYARGSGIDTRWLVIDGDPDFFTLTKRIHNLLHGSEGDGGALSDSERAHYLEVLDRNAKEILARLGPKDFVILHDPQTAGLIPAMRRAGAMVIWRCHVGSDARNEMTERAWSFLSPYLREADAFVFSRAAFVPPFLDEKRVYIIPPSIDAFSVKNQTMSAATVHAILSHIGLLNAGRARVKPVFTRLDGSLGEVRRRADVIHAGRLPDPQVPLVVQVSRWDRLKDMIGVMRGFVANLDSFPEAHLVLAGPNVRGVADDPEGGEVFDECLAAWRELPDAKRRHVHIICLPTDDVEENAAMVNALQRHAAIIVQKSLGEGFGLTVTEAMWKGRPIVASAVGGIQDQIVDGKHSLLLKDPTDSKAFGSALRRLLMDRPFAQKLGRNAKRHVASNFLAPRHLMQYVELLMSGLFSLNRAPRYSDRPAHPLVSTSDLIPL